MGGTVTNVATDAATTALAELLRQPPPRSGGEQFIAPARRRSRRQILLGSGLLAAVVAVVAVVLIVDSDPKRAIGNTSELAVALGVAFFFVVGAGVVVLLYDRQDVTVGRRLVRDGAPAPARVVDIRVGYRGAGYVKVQWQSRVGPREETFVTSCDPELLRPLQGAATLVVEHPSSADCGVYLPGVGLVTTH